MANPTKILFISGEVSPFTAGSETAELARRVPEQLQESGDYEMRILMPRYGVISERKNRLHEVIRLSGNDIPMGSDKETLRVKVASIPGVRLQVYFMDNNRYFKRKGLLTDKQGALFDDNAERALFFGRAALMTISNLGWQPDIVHAMGWIAGYVPMLIKNEFAESSLLGQAKVVFTPGKDETGPTLSARKAANLGLGSDPLIVERNLNEVGSSFADAVILPPNGHYSYNGSPRFSLDVAESAQQAAGVYEQIAGSVMA
jgi:starch synthase